MKVKFYAVVCGVPIDFYQNVRLFIMFILSKQNDRLKCDEQSSEHIFFSFTKFYSSNVQRDCNFKLKYLFR